ncbi:MAG: efflux transporter outer membrane subunit [Myxococcota bacterium]
MATRPPPFRPRLRAALAAALALVLAAGCTVGPNYVPPEADTPNLWHMDLMRGLAQGEANLQTWWTALEDPLLTSLIDRAALGSLDVHQAVARIDEARARRGIARGSWYPGILGTGDYTRQRLSEETVPIPPTSRTGSIWSTGVDASWEIDVFGRIRRSVESTTADLQASIEDYRDVLVSLFAEVGLTYVDLRTLQERIRLAELNVRNQRSTLQLVRDRNRAGLVGDLDVRQAEQNLASTESFIPTFRSQQAASIHRLSVLLGDPPSSLYAELGPPQPIPKPASEILVGVPADVLRQRPDVRQAERLLAAQTAQIGVAKADLYPRFTLVGTFALQASDFSKWFTGDAFSYGFGPAVRWNIFDGGRVRANVQTQEALTEQALVDYEQTVLGALEDVENSAVAFVQENDRRDALARSVVASVAATGLVKTLYRTGLTDFQNVLDTERTQFQQQDQLAASDGFVTQNLIRVYRALGGGWSPQP